MPLLSIVVPFHNSVGKADRLLPVLDCLDPGDVELILVDDGSSDGTAAYIRESLARPHRLVEQGNSGPGGARNTGAALATGDYLWFVDCDDRINPDAIRELRRHSAAGYDLIDFDHVRRGARRSLLALRPGPHIVRGGTRLAMLRQFGPIWTKVFRRNFWTKCGLSFPENCFYEDNPMALSVPFLAGRIYKTGWVGYFYETDQPSILRSAISPRYYDRFLTAALGTEFALSRNPTALERRMIQRRFTRLFLDRTFRLGNTPIESSLLAARIMRHYRSEGSRLGLDCSRVPKLGGSVRESILLNALWAASRCLPEQRRYFEGIRAEAWPDPIRWDMLAGAGTSSGRAQMAGDTRSSWSSR